MNTLSYTLIIISALIGLVSLSALVRAIIKDEEENDDRVPLLVAVLVGIFTAMLFSSWAVYVLLVSV